jgi:hypothetical protein
VLRTAAGRGVGKRRLGREVSTGVRAGVFTLSETPQTAAAPRSLLPTRYSLLLAQAARRCEFCVSIVQVHR